ncbi:molybdate ABC transporter permease subunit [Alteromonas sp. CYL-A6]|uniref:molybdate ABC transporter permease subunit n=1 Tax=Alteromonas nitratireducens TaxID=3390813 RepID=UPI0034BE6427
MTNSLEAIILTIKLAGVTSLILLLIGLPVAWWLAHWRHPAKPLVQAIIALPLVLPPTVLGFYLLIALSPQSPLGQAWETLTGSPLAFSFSALVIGSVIYSLPFTVQPLTMGFQQLDSRYLEAGRCLNMPARARFFRIVLPLIRPQLVTAAGLSFAHTVGEFGVVLMIGGNIPGQTRVLSVALFDHVEALNYAEAHWLAGGLLVFSALMLTVLYRFNRQGTPWTLPSR